MVLCTLPHRESSQTEEVPWKRPWNMNDIHLIYRLYTDTEYRKFGQECLERGELASKCFVIENDK